MKKYRSRTAGSMLDTLESRVLMSALPLGRPPYMAANRAAIIVSAGSKQTVGAGPTVGAPSNVTATAASATKVNLTWKTGSGANAYIIYRSTGSGFVQLAKIGASSTYADSTVSGNTTYSYYVVSSKGNTQSAASNIATVLTPAPAVVTVPDAPTGLAVTGETTNSVSLSWTDVASNESGYRVYRSTDGVGYSQVASLAAGSTGYTDGGLGSGAQYYYEVSAWNSAGEGMSAAVSDTTTTTIPSGDPITVYSRYGGELVLQGTAGNDSIYVSQSGSTLTIVANGYTSTADVPANGLFIYSFGGADTITVDSSVTLKLTIASIDGNATSVSNADANAGIWIDSTDSFSGVGVTHKVSGFYQNVTKSVGVDLVDPTDSGGTYRPAASLWGSGPVMGDVNQGGVGDCYFVASLAAFANSSPAKLTGMAVDLGDGTYAVQYLRSGTATFVRVDGDLPTGPYGGYGYAHPGGSGNIWAMIMEKSYAFFRSGSNTYASLNSGWMANVYSDFGISNTSVSLNTDSTLYSAMSNDLASGKAVTFATYSSGTSLVANHAYTLVSVSNVGGVNYYTVRNPWGMSGDSLEDGGGYATLTFAQMVANFQLGTAAV